MNAKDGGVIVYRSLVYAFRGKEKDVVSIPSLFPPARLPAYLCARACKTQRSQWYRHVNNFRRNANIVAIAYLLRVYRCRTRAMATKSAVFHVVQGSEKSCFSIVLSSLAFNRLSLRPVRVRGSRLFSLIFVLRSWNVFWFFRTFITRPIRRDNVTCAILTLRYNFPPKSNR